MSQTLTSLLIHLVFSTKHREPIITPEVEPHLFAYLGGILNNNQSRLLDAGGTWDHVHLLISQSKNIALSTLLKDWDLIHDELSPFTKDVSFETSVGRKGTVPSRLAKKTFLD